jgi:hypothetical protein
MNINEEMTSIANRYHLWDTGYVLEAIQETVDWSDISSDDKVTLIGEILKEYGRCVNEQ